ncbi:MAG: serine/threonine protein kinase [Phycisphaeraceae bacterium]|nr:MAG: serine/threonine protein kinase [Phycisphaeraceae bacterium]
MKNGDTIKPGGKIAGFNVLAELGRGAASVIYLVQDPKSKQVWALKHVLRHTPKDQRFLDQTEREYEVSSKLDSDIVRKVHKLIKIRKMMSVREMCLLMEYIDGVSIELRPPKTFVSAVDIFRRVAMGLAHMHAQGYVHADMKPNNIVVTESGDVKVIDLGQSCPIGDVKERIQGTPDYIAPEQVHRRAITPRTDIYNLGASIYWVLTGRHIPTALPKGDSLVSSLDDEFIEKPDPIHEINPRIPKRLCDLVMHCVEVNPENRPENMQHVIDRLDLIYAQLVAEDEIKAGNQKAGVGDDD